MNDYEDVKNHAKAQVHVFDRENSFRGDIMNKITKMYFDTLFAPSKKQKIITVFITIGFIIFFLTLIYKIAILENHVSDLEKFKNDKCVPAHTDIEKITKERSEIMKEPIAPSPEQLQLWLKGSTHNGR
jgi:hypothetical protein